MWKPVSAHRYAPAKAFGGVLGTVFLAGPLRLSGTFSQVRSIVPHDKSYISSAALLHTCMWPCSTDYLFLIDGMFAVQALSPAQEVILVS